MTLNEWQVKQDYYEKTVLGINIPPDLDPANIIRLHSELDKISAKARFELSKAKAAHDRIKLRLKLAERFAYKKCAEIESDPSIPKEQKPKNDKQRDAWTVDYLTNNPLQGMQLNIYKAMEIYIERYEFMQAVVDSLKEKSDRLITGLGCLKLDSDATGERLMNGAETIAQRSMAIQYPSGEPQ